jgi:Skp family chaperone for outer membrane proteins
MSEVIDRHTFAAMLKSADGNLKKMSAPRALSNRLSVEEWTGIITDDFNRSVEGIVAAGRHLQEAKDQLDHGEFGPLLDRLNLHPRAAERLIKIANNEVLANPTHWVGLPTFRRTLSELATLPPEFLEEKIADGAVNPNTTRKDVEALRATLKATLKGKARQNRQKTSGTRRALSCGTGRRREFEERASELEAELEAARDRERKLCSEIETLRAKVAELEDREASQPQSARASANQIVDLTEDDMRRRWEEMALLESLGQMTFGWRRRRAGVPYRTHKAAAAEVAS